MKQRRRVKFRKCPLGYMNSASRIQRPLKGKASYRRRPKHQPANP